MKGLAIMRHGEVISLYHANNFFSRVRGLLGRRLRGDQGMLIEPCAAIHTFGMSAEIDVLYLDRNNRLIKIVERLQPWRASACRGARKVLELPAGRARAYQFLLGESLVMGTGGTSRLQREQPEI